MRVTLYWMIRDDSVDFDSDESNTETPLIQNRKKNAPVRETAPIIISQKTPNLSISSDKLGEITANMMAIKSFFMNAIYELKNEISLLRSLNDRNEIKEPENSLSINVLETELVFL